MLLPPASETPALHLFSYRLRLREQIQIVGATGLGICAGHVESAEGVRAHHRARALAVDVEVAHVEVAPGAVDLVARFGIDGARETELGVVGDFEGVIEACLLYTSRCV